MSQTKAPPWNVMVALPGERDILGTGHLACQGCGIMPAYRLILRTLGPKTMVCVPACCLAVVDGPFPFSATGVPLMHCAFETAAATASGIRAALDVTGQEDVHVLAIAGDGGTFDIGMQALSAAAERNENILYVCYDNEAYMNTGIQRSSATPDHAWTTTTPTRAPKQEAKKDLGAIMAAHRIPYFATASLSHMDDMIRKVEKARDMKGFRLIHYFCPCPTGWKSDPASMVELARLAVDTGVFPLYEVESGRRYRINIQPSSVPVKKYLELQGRFKHLSPSDIEGIQSGIGERWSHLRTLATAFPAMESAAS